MATVDQATRNEHVIRRWVEEVGNRRDVALVDELMAADFVAHFLGYEPWSPPGMEGKHVREAIKEGVLKGDPNFEIFHSTIDQIHSSGDVVVDVVTTTGTRKGNEITMTEIFITRFKDGKMVEGWTLGDRLGFYQQLGAVPETAQLRKQAGLTS